MCKLSWKQRKLFTAHLPATIFFLALSLPACHAQSNCSTPQITSVTPTTWVAGLTFNVTVNYEDATCDVTACVTKGTDLQCGVLDPAQGPPFYFGFPPLDLTWDQVAPWWC
jgi:hypothetical protein